MDAKTSLDQRSEAEHSPSRHSSSRHSPRTPAERSGAVNHVQTPQCSGAVNHVHQLGRSVHQSQTPIRTPEGLAIETMFRIADKEGQDVDFKLNSAQALVDSTLSGRDVIPKARQEGVSSYFLARYTACCIGRRNTRAVVISHDRESTERMLAKVHYYVKNLKGGPPTVGLASKNELTFPKTDSRFFIGTAGARKFGRGDTITHLHCSEVAFWEDPKTLTAGLFQAVPLTGEIAIESTGNGTGNWYHKMCMRAARGDSRYSLHFLPWHTFEEYKIPLDLEEKHELLMNLKEEWEEPQLLDRGLTPEQLMFRRDKLDSLDHDLNLFKQEYPMTLDECFQLTGSGIFTKFNYIETSDWKQDPVDKNLRQLYGHPSPYHQYIMGIDVAAGLGGQNPDADASVIEVFSLTSLQQVAEYVSDRISPDRLGYKAREIGLRFNKAFCVPELNNHGILTVATLRKIYPKHLIYKNKRPKSRKASEPEAQRDSPVYYGWQTRGGQGAQSRFAAIGRLREALSDDWTIYSPILKNELSTFVENDDTGKLEAAPGCHDDTVIASMCCVVGAGQATRRGTAPDVRRTIEASYDQFSMEHIISELTSEEDTAASMYGVSVKD